MRGEGRRVDADDRFPAGLVPASPELLHRPRVRSRAALRLMEATVLPRPAALRLEGSLVWLLPLAVVSALCALYLVLDLHPVDLAASTYRARLFEDHGFALWNGNWYGGHYTLSYSLLAPPLTWLIGSLSLLVASAGAAAPPFPAPPPRPLRPAGRARAG